DLTAELLHAEAASGGITPVARAAACLLVCHGSVFLLLRCLLGRALARSRLLRGGLLRRRLLGPALCRLGLLRRGLAVLLLRLGSLLRPSLRLLAVGEDVGDAHHR